MSEKDLPSPEYLRQRLRYEPETGRLIWRESSEMRQCWNTRYVDTQAGRVNNRGYVGVKLDGCEYQAHRIIWTIVYGDWPKSEIDHINGNRLDNRIDNLRDVDRVENGRNLAKRKDNTSGVTGVYWNRQCHKWEARIMVNNATKYLGLFSNIEDAVNTRKAAEMEFEFHTNHGRAAIAAEHIS